MHPKDLTGRYGEELAARHLSSSGHTVIARNWRNRRGELDIITQHEGELVAVEVKTRRGIGYGHPLEAITAVKLQRLHRLLLDYCAEEGLLQRRRRVDAVSVVLGKAGEVAEVDHIKDIRL